MYIGWVIAVGLAGLALCIVCTITRNRMENPRAQVPPDGPIDMTDPDDDPAGIFDDYEDEEALLDATAIHSVHRRPIPGRLQGEVFATEDTEGTEHGDMFAGDHEAD